MMQGTKEHYYKCERLKGRVRHWISSHTIPSHTLWKHYQIYDSYLQIQTNFTKEWSCFTFLQCINLSGARTDEFNLWEESIGWCLKTLAHLLRLWKVTTITIYLFWLLSFIVTLKQISHFYKFLYWLKCINIIF